MNLTPASLFRLATEDQHAATILLQSEPPQTRHASFWLQQAAEKYLKAVLLHAGHHSYPHTHNLLTLSERLPPTPLLTADLESALVELTTYCTAARYHDEWPSLDELQKALATCEQVQRLALSFLDFD